MKINSISSYKINTIKYSKPHICKTSPHYPDSVSFSGLLKYQNNPNVQEALELGIEIYNTKTNFEDVSKLLKSKIPEINVLPLEEFPAEQTGNIPYDALYTYNITKNGVENLNLYIPKEIKDNSDIFMLNYAAKIAHEYTHAMQVAKNEDTDFLNHLTKGDYNYLQSLILLGDSAFSIFDHNIRNDVLTPSFNAVDKFNASIWGFVTPREKAVSKVSVLKKAGFKNKEAFEEYMKNVFNQVFAEITEFILKDEETANSEILKPVKEKIKKENGVTDFADDLIKYCLYSAKKEAQAYTTECMLTKKILGINSAINLDIVPFYYEMLEEALK